MSTDNFDISEEFMRLKEDAPLSNDRVEPLEAASDSTLYSDDTKKKKKKKKKKKDKFDSFDSDKIALLLDPGSLGSDADDIGLDSDEFLIEKKVKKGKKKNLFDMKAAKKKKKENYETKFNPEMIQYRKILKDNDEVATLIKGMVEDIRKSNTRGAGKLLTDLLITLNSTNGNRASVIRDMVNIKKAAVDLELKANRNKKEEKEARNEEEEGLNVFNAFYGGGGRKALLDQIASNYHSMDGYSSAQEVPKFTYDPRTNNDDDVFDAINDRLDNEDIDFRSEDGNAYIRYEYLSPEYVILMHTNNGETEWELEAIDKDGNIMPSDYPRIPIENLGKVTFNMDSMSATDETGRTYRVIES